MDEISARERVWEGGYPRGEADDRTGTWIGRVEGDPFCQYFFSLSLRSCLLLRPPTALLVRYRFAERCRFVVRVILAAVIRSPPVLTQRSRDEESPSRGSCSRDPRDRNRWVFTIENFSFITSFFYESSSCLREFVGSKLFIPLVEIATTKVF